MKLKLLFICIVVAGVLCGSASAASIYSTCVTGAPCAFNMSGQITVTTSTITWHTDAPGGAANEFTLTAGSGVFSTIPSGSQEGIADLSNPPDVVGAPFAPTVFITFLTDPTLPSLDIDFIHAGIFSAAQCAATPAAVGQVCTLPGSPFSFTNNPGNSANPIQSQAGFVFNGVSHDGVALWTANFTAQFNVPYQTVLAAFAPGGSGSVVNSYSATATVTFTPEPETTVLMSAGLGLILLSSLLRRKLHYNR